MPKQVITADLVRQAVKLGQNCLYLETGCIVTQQATDDAKKLGVSLIVGNPNQTMGLATGQIAGQTMGLAPGQIASQTMGLATAMPNQAQNLIPTQFNGVNPLNPLAATLLSVTRPHVSAPTHMPMPPQAAAPHIPMAQATAPHIPMAQATAPHIPMAQAIPNPILPVGIPTVQAIPGHNPMAAPPITQADRESLIAKVRAEVLKALPSELKADANLLDILIKKTIAEKPCLTCGCDACPSAPPSTQLAPLKTLDLNAPLNEVGGVIKVNNQALGLGKLQPHSVNMVDALDKTARVSYLEWDNTSFSWTFQQPEILVVLEGSLQIKLAGQTLTAMAGDVLSIPANVQLELGSNGYVKCTTVNPA